MLNEYYPPSDQVIGSKKKLDHLYTNSWNYFIVKDEQSPEEQLTVKGLEGLLQDELVEPKASLIQTPLCPVEIVQYNEDLDSTRHMKSRNIWKPDCLDHLKTVNSKSSLDHF